MKLVCYASFNKYCIMLLLEKVKLLTEIRDKNKWNLSQIPSFSVRNAQIWDQFPSLIFIGDSNFLVVCYKHVIHIWCKFLSAVNSKIIL